MSNYYDETVRLARLIGLDYYARDALRTVWRQTEGGSKHRPVHEAWVPWRPFTNRTDCQMVVEWARDQGATFLIGPLPHLGSEGDGCYVEVNWKGIRTYSEGPRETVLCRVVLLASARLGLQPKPTEQPTKGSSVKVYIEDCCSRVDRVLKGQYWSRNGILLKLTEEVGELVRAYRRPEESPENEAGDVLFALIALCNREGLNLEAGFQNAIQTHQRLEAANDPRVQESTTGRE